MGGRAGQPGSGWLAMYAAEARGRLMIRCRSGVRQSLTGDSQALSQIFRSRRHSIVHDNGSSIDAYR